MRTLLKIPPTALLLAFAGGAAGALALALSPADQETATRAPMARLSFECSTDAECAATPPCALKPGCDGGPNSQPYRLVGYDCAGATEPLYRDEEDEFPEGGCAAIEATWATE